MYAFKIGDRVLCNSRNYDDSGPDRWNGVQGTVKTLLMLSDGNERRSDDCRYGVSFEDPIYNLGFCLDTGIPFKESELELVALTSFQRSVRDYIKSELHDEPGTI